MKGNPKALLEPVAAAAHPSGGGRDRGEQGDPCLTGSGSLHMMHVTSKSVEQYLASVANGIGRYAEQVGFKIKRITHRVGSGSFYVHLRRRADDAPFCVRVSDHVHPKGDLPGVHYQWLHGACTSVAHVRAWLRDLAACICGGGREADAQHGRGPAGCNRDASSKKRKKNVTILVLAPPLVIRGAKYHASSRKRHNSNELTPVLRKR